MKLGRLPYEADVALLMKLGHSSYGTMWFPYIAIVALLMKLGRSLYESRPFSLLS